MNNSYRPFGGFSVFPPVIKNLLIINVAVFFLQMIASNLDVAFIVQSCHYDFNIRRLERYLVVAEEGNIEPVVATIVPVTRRAEEFEGYSITGQVRQFNAKAKEFARRNGFKLVDYFEATADSEGFLPDDMARDAIHPNALGYDKMAAAYRAAMK